jgi:glucose/arabinose dehydrogenase
VRLVTLCLVLALLLSACGEQPPPTASPSGGETAAPTVLTTPAGQGARAGTPGPEAATRPAARRAQPFDPAAVTLALQEVVRGFTQPVFVTGAGDGSGRLFVVEQGGTIRVVQNGTVLPQPFLDIRGLVRAGGEQGLLGMAFHPRYAENGRFFVNYTARDGANTVAEFRVSRDDPNRADPSTRRVLLAIPDFAPNHNAGMLAFGPDGYLYVGTGDGGGAGDPRRTAQNLRELLGKMLRLDVDGGDPYGIPPDNPFVGRGDARPEVWAYGLRNPWRYSFDRATGDLWIGDVGQNAWEEIDFQPAASRGGENYGWSIMEGSHCFRPSSGCDPTGLVLPVAEYATHAGGTCAVTGGYVYRGSAFPALLGVYLYADYCSGQMWALYPDASGAWRSAELLRAPVRISSFGEDEAGELYVTGHDTGIIYRVTASPR